jgi:hypothetical protein
MSYSRFSTESDVYVYPGAEGLVCCACRLEAELKDFTTTTRTAMIHHLREHAARGHKVPSKVFRRLEEELTNIGDLYQPDEEN